VRVTLVRHATIRIEIGGHVLLVDPMLDEAGVRGPVRGTPNALANPLVPLPMSVADAVAGVDAVLLSHTHVDHLDAAGVTAVPSHLTWFCQPEDHAELVELGFASAEVVPDGEALDWEGLRIARTGGRHGREEAAVQGLGPVSGFVISADGEPTVYVAGDTVWCPEVERALADHSPDWIVVNAGGARFLQGGTITMEAGDVVAVAEAAPAARVVAVHIEAINHCLETRADLRAAVAAAGVGDRVSIPADGETLSP
jgi:L-ascorbate metabolism protein UlaG (beta-lactamase superfamily)